MGHISLRTLITGLLLTVVLFTVVHTAISQYQFRRAAVSYRIDSMARVIEVAALEVLRQGRGHAITLGSSLQHRLHLQDLPDLTAQLAAPFSTGYVEAGYLDLVALRVYDPEMRPLGSGGTAQIPALPIQLMQQMLSRQGVERLKALGDLWRTPQGPLYSVLIPVGDLQVSGYLEVVFNPLFNLRKVSEMIHMPVGIHDAHNMPLLHPDDIVADDPRYAAMEYALRGADGTAAYVVAYADVDLLYNDMRRIQHITTLSFLILTVAVLGLAFWLLNRHLFQPVQQMIGQMEHVLHHEDQTLVTGRGIKEVHVVAASFNLMATRVREIIQELHRISAQDGLTGIANRRSFNQALEREWLRAMRQQTPLSALLIDIDYFKQYNDHYGHQAGDECLKNIASSLSLAVLRPTDMVARYGGEEFVLLLPETDRHGALTIAERLQQVVTRLAIPHAMSPREQVSMSIGACTLIPQRDQPSQRLIACADRALYRAKAAGRSRIEVGSADDDAAGTAAP